MLLDHCCQEILVLKTDWTIWFIQALNLGVWWSLDYYESTPWGEEHSKCAAPSQRTWHEGVIITTRFDDDHAWWSSSSTCIFSLLTFFFSLWDIDLEFKLVFLAKHSLYMEKATILLLSSVVFSLLFTFSILPISLIAFPFLLAHKMPPVT